jgi:hypothetical protein
MVAVEVTVRFTEDGQITPLQVVWKGQSYPINQVGRRWQDALGDHFLVMIPVEKVVELLFSNNESRWYLNDPVRGSRSPV